MGVRASSVAKALEDAERVVLWLGGKVDRAQARSYAGGATRGGAGADGPAVRPYLWGDVWLPLEVAEYFGLGEGLAEGV